MHLTPEKDHHSYARLSDTSLPSIWIIPRNLMFFLDTPGKPNQGSSQKFKQGSNLMIKT